MIDANGPRGFKLMGRHVLAAMVVFFGCVIAVNLTFVFFALDSWTGLTDHDSYRTGLSWNRTLEADAAQKALGWRTRIDVNAGAGTDGSLRRTLVLEVQDRAGRPINGLSVDGEARHPVVEAMDTPLALTAAGDGRYTATITFPAASNWQLRLVATGPGQPAYRIDSVVVVR